MSQRLISRSPDLKRLRDEGYDLAVVAGHLLLRDVPYLNAAREIQRGVLVSTLNLADDVTCTPDTHVAYFIGSYPCHVTGAEIEQIRHGGRHELARDLVVNHSFSNKPIGGYLNYYDKLTRYVAIIAGPALEIDPSIRIQSYPVIECGEEESVFMYLDTASSRAAIGAASAKLEIGPVAIIGLGGTGSYVLDLLAKTPVAEIHLFDGDVFSQHNAFRSPGAPSGSQLGRRPSKVSHLRAIYANMRRHLIAHEYFMDAGRVSELDRMVFVFICMDRGAAKRAIVEHLEAQGIAFIDVGMGIHLGDDRLSGLLRVTTSTPEKRSHFRTRVSLCDTDQYNDYDTNVQVADLNALNAALAVIRWKKLYGFYHDAENEHNGLYAIIDNSLVNEDCG
jgi:hypothetical protein